MSDERLGGVDRFTGGDRSRGKHASPSRAGLGDPDWRRVGSDWIRFVGGTNRGGGGEEFKAEDAAKIRRRLAPKGDREHWIRVIVVIGARPEIYGLTKPDIFMGSLASYRRPN